MAKYIMEESMFEPFVGIVVPCYNAEATIARALTSIRLSRYANYEVILVNDGSSDRTLEILNEFASLDNRLVVIDQRNSGVSATRNRGVAASSADYIAFLDADDIFFDTSLQERMKVFALEDDPEMIGVFCPSVMLGENMEFLREEPLFDHMLPQNRLYFSSLNDSIFNPTSVIMKKSAFTAVGGFNESLCPAEDFEFWHRVLRHGGYFRKVEDCYVGWVQHPASASHANILKHYRQCRKVFEIINSPADGIVEFQQGLGGAVQHRSLTKKAFTSSLMAAIIGQQAEADEISQDISRICLEQTFVTELVDTVKFCAMRVLCRPESDWPARLWPIVRVSVLSFLVGLSERFDNKCLALAATIIYLDSLPVAASSTESDSAAFDAGDRYDYESTEILPVSLIDEHKEIVEMIHRRSAELKVGLGWHYLLDLIWIIKNISSLPRGSVVLDAGAGNGLLQFILADMGYRIVSADFSERIIPHNCLTRYTILKADSGRSYDNEYTRHLSTEFQARRHTDEPSARSAGALRELITQCDEGTIIYYRTDLCSMAELEDASIDCIVSVSALEHNSPENLTIAVHELERVLKPGRSMLITLSAADNQDWFHEQSKGWCFTEITLARLFSLQRPRSNFNRYDQHFQELQTSNYLQQHLDPCYYRSGNNGMPWGKWDPEYQPVGIRKLRRVTGTQTEVTRDESTTAQHLCSPANANRPPIAAFIDTTDGCNLHCSFCSRNNGKITMMNVEEFGLILDRVSPYINSLQLSCAWEYSISPIAGDIVRTLGRYNIETTTIYTNGQILSEALAASIIEAGITNLVFSIGEAKRVTYERIRKGGSFDRIIGNITMIKRMKERTGAAWPRLCANLTVINSNIAELPDFVDMAHGLGITEIRGRHLILNEGMEVDTEIIRDAARANHIIETARSRAARYGITFQVPLYSRDGGEKNCRAPWSQLYIASNGDVAVCPRIHKYSTIGNLLQQEMGPLLAGTELTGLRRQMESRSFNNPVCGICIQNKETEIYINQGF
ncbi:MAG: glycosyltransferase [Deltaproteobacteria bacterium]|nr:glycosyltransferase [Deltaproteobacteria bacterium]TLN04792.1 MAG: glycosyltransferase [bacterium]